MNRKSKDIRQIMLLCFLFAFIILSSNTSAYAEEMINHSITIKQVIQVNAGYSKPKDSFHYTMKAETPDAPLPEGEADTYSFFIQGDGEKELAISYDKAGDYLYKLYQNKNDTINNCKQDEEVYDIHVRVIATEGKLKAFTYMILGKEGYKHGDVSFLNSYTFSNTAIIDRILPNTGDAKNIMSYLGLLILLGFFMVIIGRINREKEEV